MHDSDRADVALAAAGDAGAFERLYWRHAARIKALARRFLGSSEAEDGTQEVFVRAWSRLGQFRGDAAFGTWLHRLAVNVLLRLGERQKGQPSGEAHDPALLEAHTKERDVDLEKALQTLPAGVREVVVLHDMESYTHEEIASALAIGVSASKMRLHRGRSALRALMKGPDP
jgi:RNA polymerase sigma factor (sigma-70 family)